MRITIALLISSSTLALPLLVNADTQYATVPPEMHAIIPCDSCGVGVTSASAIQTQSTDPTAGPSDPSSWSGSGPKDGNAILRHLPELFILNAMFANYSNGILTPGPASLGNILELYRIFYL